MRLVSRIVEGEKHDFTAAADGMTALAMVQRDPPDLILLDINIPGLNGLELARRFRKRRVANLIPLIATTANAL